MARRQRVDAELVRRGLARSRQHAAELVEQGRVTISGMVATKPATQVELAAALHVTDPTPEDTYVSRGAHKLISALDALPEIDPTGKICLDAGASTGGFTDVLLRRGAEHVWAVDVGYGQLAWAIRQDPRVSVLERTNIRNLTLENIGTPASLVVADLSFISLRMVLAPLLTCSTPDAHLLVMVKPQFEVGRERLGSRGVVRNPEHKIESVEEVAEAALQIGYGVHGVTPSGLPGPQGNTEYFLWLRPAGQRGALNPDTLKSSIRAAVVNGPGPNEPSAHQESQ